MATRLPCSARGAETVLDYTSPTHCAWCSQALEHTPGKRKKRFCNDRCRAAAHQVEARRPTRADSLSGVPRHIPAYAEDAVAAYRALPVAIEELQALAEQLTRGLAAAGDLRAVQALIDQAETALKAREAALRDRFVSED